MTKEEVIKRIDAIPDELLNNSFTVTVFKEYVSVLCLYSSEVTHKLITDGVQPYVDANGHIRSEFKTDNDNIHHVQTSMW